MADAKDKIHAAKSVSHIILDVQPSCIEFCSLREDIFVVGSYKLEAESDLGKEDDDYRSEKLAQVRSGTLGIYKLEDDLRVKLLQTIATDGGVLDLQFSVHDPEIIAVALSTGTLQLWHLKLSPDSASVSAVFSQHLADGLLLACTWNPVSTKQQSLAVTTSTGSFAVLCFSDDWRSLAGDVSFHDAHTLEAWTLAWSSGSNTVSSAGDSSIYTGGDDAVLCHWDLSLLEYGARTEDDRLPADMDLEKHLVQKGVGPQPGLQADRRTHDAGVTAILPLAQAHDGSDVVVTGSYDEHIRVLARGRGVRWKTLAEKHLHGGVWRLKALESTKESSISRILVLASCMHAGCKLLSINQDAEGSWSIEVVASFEEHQSMNYASDATKMSVSEGASDRHAIISTSFFDRRLCVWTSPFEEPT